MLLARFSPTSGSCINWTRSARLRSTRPAEGASRSNRVGRAPQRIDPREESAIRRVARPSRTAMAHWAVRGQATRTSAGAGAGPPALAGVEEVWLMFLFNPRPTTGWKKKLLYYPGTKETHVGQAFQPDAD